MELSDWLSIQSRQIKTNVEIVKLPQAYHISDDAKIKNFVPMIGMRQAPTEDRTVPRVCCSESIYDAIKGHAAVSNSMIGGWVKGNVEVFSVYEFTFNEYLKPNTKLVFDAEITNELWVVPYSPKTTYFKAPIVSKFTMSDYALSYSAGVSEETVTFVGVSDKPVLVGIDTYFKGGFELVIKFKGAANSDRFYNDMEIVSLKKVSPSKFDKLIARINKTLTKQ